MAHVCGPEIVKYACHCGLLKPISQLYFCRHCSKIRCSFCVCHEVDSLFCGKCSENIPSAEARIKKNRCGNCLVCPSCQQDLGPRIAATSKTQHADEPKTPVKKMHYLLCQYCRWTSRDVGIPDQTSVTGFPDRDNVHGHRLQEVLDAYKAVVLSQKQQKENDKKKQRKKYMSYTDMTGVTAAALRKRIGLPADRTHPLLKSKPKKPEPAVAVEEVEELPDSIFTEPLNFLEVTSIDQRLLYPESQPVTVDKMFPVHKQLSIKRSLRCRACEHNVSKPEYNPNSVKFKIQLFAYYHIPDIRIVTVEPLRAGKPVELILKFTNPTQHQTDISFLELVITEPEDEEIKETEESLDSLSLQDKQPISLPSLTSTSQPSSLLSLPSHRQPSITIKPRKIEQNINCKVEIPTSSFILPPRDDAAEYDDSGDTHNIQDDTKLVKRRKANKAFIKLTVTPDENLPLNEEVVCGFTMRHLYTNTMLTHQPQKYERNVQVFLTLGNIVGSE
ncbi:dynactin subunit 4 [Aethina tumida]|uniref:dynactin subunit 4 n=1 Tax=Aethina tumida TaxID=116153 RepID=UPI002149131F|nr:dynactin subunit 4 [Aethina tumida]